MKLDELGADDFRALIGQRFEVDRGDGTTEALVLARVTDLVEAGRSPAEPGRRRAFSAVFVGSTGPAFLRQRIYPFTQERLGTIEIFIVPIGPAAEGMQYEAVFN